MQENSKDYYFCLKLALDNAKNRWELIDRKLDSETEN